jgi:hypothetical protein
MGKPSGNFGAFEVLSLGGAGGATAIVFPKLEYSYFVHSFAVIWTAASGNNGWPNLQVSLDGIVISQVAQLGSVIFNGTGLLCYFSTRQTQTMITDNVSGLTKVDLSGAVVVGDLQADYPDSIGTHVSLPPQGLYVPRNALCRFGNDQGNSLDSFSGAVALIAESL